MEGSPAKLHHAAAHADREDDHAPGNDISEALLQRPLLDDKAAQEYRNLADQHLGQASLLRDQAGQRGHLALSAIYRARTNVLSSDGEGETMNSAAADF